LTLWQNRGYPTVQDASELVDRLKSHLEKITQANGQRKEWTAHLERSLSVTCTLELLESEMKQLFSEIVNRIPDLGFDFLDGAYVQRQPAKMRVIAAFETSFMQLELRLQLMVEGRGRCWHSWLWIGCV
jgi:hypothetical protein